MNDNKATKTLKPLYSEDPSFHQDPVISCHHPELPLPCSLFLPVLRGLHLKVHRSFPPLTSVDRGGRAGQETHAAQRKLKISGFHSLLILIRYLATDPFFYLIRHRGGPEIASTHLFSLP